MEFALLIPIMALSIPIFAIWTRHQRKLAEMQLRTGDQQIVQASGAMLEHVRELEDRVRVLERIVTDKGYDVAHQIEALRDARQTAALLDRADTLKR